jgi:hypothetical protein
MQDKVNLARQGSSNSILNRKKDSRKSSKILSDYLCPNKTDHKLPERKKRPPKYNNINKADENAPRQFYTPNLGTQAKAEKAANSNNESSGKDCSIYFQQGENASQQVSGLEHDYKRDKQFFKEKSGITTSEKHSLLNNTQGDEAEKVEESLRDFIGKIIGYYEKFNVGNSLLGKYEKKISQAETLLEVFDLMKEMFEELMQNVLKESKGLLDCSDVSQTEVKEPEIEAIIYQFEKEIKVMSLREKELVRLAAQHERELKAKENETKKIKEKYDEVLHNNNSGAAQDKRHDILHREPSARKQETKEIHRRLPTRRKSLPRKTKQTRQPRRIQSKRQDHRKSSPRKNNPEQIGMGPSAKAIQAKFQRILQNERELL